MRLVSQAQTSRSRAQALADRAARLLTIVAIVAGGATFAAWALLGVPIDFTITRVVTVLVIACPHALGLAVPLVVAISTTLGAQNGLLVRDRRGLEEARSLDIVVFDKTGTLTLGAHRVVETVPADGRTLTRSFVSPPRSSATPNIRLPRRSSQAPRNRASTCPRQRSSPQRRGAEWKPLSRVAGSR